ncbi:MAG: peptidoglycan-binding protein [Lentisphaerae bacterium]|nr:peptidoglycan-binding protein [Lentisphaerota bacterium]
MKSEIPIRYLTSLAATTVLFVAGCATPHWTAVDAGYAELSVENGGALMPETREVAPLAPQTVAPPVAPVAPPAAPSSDAGLLPPNAKPGECYARVYLPPTYTTVEERVMIRGASEKVDMIPAVYEWVEEDVIVKEASERLEVVPAQYELREKQVLVNAASSRVEHVPAEYEWVEENVLVEAAHTEWKKGRSPLSKVDNGTGEIMCLIEIPAKYKTVKKRVLKTPDSSRTIELPAVYTTITENVMVSPQTTRTIAVPAEVEKVRVQRLVTPEEKRVIPVEPEYQNVTKQVVSQMGGIGWRRVLCETNLSQDIIKQIQQALLAVGNDPGPIDGIIGTQTQMAVEAYQNSNGLAVGGLTYEMLSQLGVDVNGDTE